MSATAAAVDKDDILQGDALKVLPKLLAEGRMDAVLAAFRALLERNEQLERHLAMIAGRRTRANEGVSADQLDLFVKQLAERLETGAADEDEAEANEALRRIAEEAARQAREDILAGSRGEKRKPLKKPLPAHLVRKPNVIAVPDAERTCPKCGAKRECIGHDVSEVLEFEPAKLYVRQDKREKLACRPCDGEPVRAPRGDKVAVGGQFGCSLVAKILHDKYWLGIPLHRQKQEFERLGLAVPVSTLADQVQWGTDLLNSLRLAAENEVFAAPVMNIDGTGLPALDRDRDTGKKLGVLWGTVGADENGPRVAAYFYTSSKMAKATHDDEKGPHQILSKRTGIVVSDADSVFIEQKKRDDLIDCGCNMHARRYFVKALDAGDDRAALPIGAFKALYQVEEEVAGKPLDERTAIRQARSKPIYDDLARWCRSHQANEPPKSPLGRAISYLLNHELALRRYLDDGVIPIDNGAAERAFVRVALTRKNFLFVGSDAGGRRAATAYTLLACCRLADVDPVEYLTDVLATLSRGIRFTDAPALLPAAWKARRQP